MINNPVHKQLPTLENPGTAIDLRSGKSLIAPDGSVVTGTLPEVEQATPSISVSSGGLITASAVQAGGIVADGTKSATQQLDTQGGTTITPGTAAKTAVAAGRYTTGTVTVAGDSNLASANIAKGVSIFGVAGSYSGTEPVYEIASTGNVQFESSPAFAGNYEHHAKITVSRNVGQLLGLSLWLILGDNSTLFSAILEPLTRNQIQRTFTFYKAVHRLGSGILTSQARRSICTENVGKYGRARVLHR